MEDVEGAPGPVGVFLDVTTLAYDNDVCRGAGVLAVTAADVEGWPLAVGVRAAAVVELGAVVVWFVGAGFVLGAMLVIRLFLWRVVWVVVVGGCKEMEGCVGCVCGRRRASRILKNLCDEC